MFQIIINAIEKKIARDGVRESWEEWGGILYISHDDQRRLQ